MDIQKELITTKENWMATVQRANDHQAEFNKLQIQIRQLEGRYALLEELVKEASNEDAPKN